MMGGRGEWGMLGVRATVVVLVWAVGGDGADGAGQAFRELARRETAQGVLSGWGDVDKWRFGGDAGEIVRVVAESADFDVKVELWHVGGGQLGRDDDGGGGTDAALTVVLPATGWYEVRVAGFGGGVGEYKVGVRAAEVVSLGRGSGQGFLGAGTAAGGWRFAGEAGEVVEVRASSAAFDTVLEVRTVGGEEISWNDDSGGGTNSRVVAILPVSGEYIAWVGRFGEGMGIYEIAVGTLRAAVAPDAGVWAFFGKRGERVEVSAGSDAFDTMVELQTVGGEELGRDGDNGPGTDSRLMVTLPRDGEYRVVVSGADARAGPYDVAVRRLPVRLIELGGVVEGVLGEDGGIWRFTVTMGQTVVVSAGSDVFDTVVELRAADGEVLERDDDGGAGTDSRLVATLPEQGEYEIVVGAYGDGGGGYTVSVERGEAALLEWDTSLAARPMEVGETVDGVLGSDRGVWRFWSEGGRTVVVSAVSDAFDTVLELRSVDGEGTGTGR